MEYFPRRLRISVMEISKTGADILKQLPHLRRYALSLTRHPSDAEDLVHDTVLRAYERRSSFRAGSDLRAWLMSILHNAWVDGVRSRISERQRINRAFEGAADHEPAVQDISLRLSDVRRAFLSLPDEQRAAAHLVMIEDLSYQETADILGVTVGTVMSRIARAREKLRLIDETDPAQPRLRLVRNSNDGR